MLKMANQDVDEFVSSSEQILEKCSIASLAQKWILAVQGAVRMRIQTADTNITIIHITPVHQLTSLWEEETTHQHIFLASNHCI